MQQHDLAGEAARLAEIVGRQHDLDAARDHRTDHVLDRLGGGGIEARGRLVEEQHLRIARERAGEREALLLAAGQPPRRPLAQSCEADQRRAVRRCAGRHSARAVPALGERIFDVGGGGAAQHDRTLEHDGAALRRGVRRPPQVTRPEVGSIRPMARRISVVLPEPFGPISTVGAPGINVSEMPSRIVTPRTP